MDARVLAIDPPASPEQLPGEVTDTLSQALGWVMWGCVAVSVGALMLTATLFIIDNRQVDEYGTSPQAICIKVIAGCLLIGVASGLAKLFV